MKLMSFLFAIFFSFSSWGFVKDKHFKNRITFEKPAPVSDSGIVLKTQQQQIEENRVPAQVNRIPDRPYPDGVPGEWKKLRDADSK